MNISPLWLVTNAASGSNSDAAVDDLAASLTTAGYAPARIIRFPDEELPERAELDAAGVATLAIFTGDGTANSAASRLEGWDGAILIFPGGTQNLLSKALHGDVTADAITAALATGATRRVRRRVVRTSQGPALVEVLVGPGALWADVREGLRDLDIGTIADSFGTAMRETREGPGVVLAQPAAGKADGYRAIRFVPGAGPMEADGYDFTDLADLAAQGFAMLVKRDFRQGPHDHLGSFDKATCRSEAPIALMIDGERSEGGTEEHFACEEFAVDFIATLPAGD
ncbi:MAG: diacylglycerol kinase family protein [Pseudomonadota bacterium]